MTIIKVGKYYVLYVADQALMQFDSLERAADFASIGPAMFCGHDAEGLAIYRNVVL